MVIDSVHGLLALVVMVLLIAPSHKVEALLKALTGTISLASVVHALCLYILLLLLVFLRLCGG